METKQVEFTPDGEEVFGGILCDNEFIICGCCGGVYEKGEVTILKTFNLWVPLSDEILGE